MWLGITLMKWTLSLWTGLQEVPTSIPLTCMGQVGTACSLTSTASSDFRRITRSFGRSLETVRWSLLKKFNFKHVKALSSCYCSQRLMNLSNFWGWCFFASVLHWPPPRHYLSGFRLSVTAATPWSHRSSFPTKRHYYVLI
jgi:hypothetical protein